MLKTYTFIDAIGINEACSKGNEISPPKIPALGFTSSGSLNRPNYLQIVDSGEAWENLYAADHFITKQKQWRDKYTLYCVGEFSKPVNMVAKENLSFLGYNNQTIEELALN